MSLTKNHLKIITRLKQKKYREKEQLFIAEGIKVVNEFLRSSYKEYLLFCTDDFNVNNDNVIRVSENDLKKISQLKTPNKVVGIFHIPKENTYKEQGLTIALDAVNDPGNLGTIIRLCDWFGITQLICSKNTVDCYNFKVVQSSMGSLTRVFVSYVDLSKELKNTKLPKYIADMNGNNIYKNTLPNEAILIMGNEANGVSKEIKKLVNTVVSIPRFGNLQATESLNVATATAILISEFRRNVS